MPARGQRLDAIDKLGHWFEPSTAHSPEKARRWRAFLVELVRLVVIVLTPPRESAPVI
jgi:hypothetical protein